MTFAKQLTYYKEFTRPDRRGVPDTTLVRAIAFATTRLGLGHNVIRLRTNKGYRVYFSPYPLRFALAKELP